MDEASSSRDPTKSYPFENIFKKRKNSQRMPSSQLHARFHIDEDAAEDVTAPDRTSAAAAQFMNQSIFSMITAAGSRRDFNARFDESSESEAEDGENKTASRSKFTPLKTAARDKENSQKADHPKSRDRKKSLENELQPSLPETLEQGDQKISPRTRSPSPSSDSTGGSSRSNPRDAPMMSRLLTAEAEFHATVEDVDSPQTALTEQALGDRGDSSPATLLATRLMEIFGFDEPETVIAEYPCWLLQSVLLQGYMYITRRHVCFYAYLPRKSHKIARSGYLMKKARSTGKYHRYWFILKGDVLSYYSNPSDLYFPQGNIDLRYGISAKSTAEKEKQKDSKDIVLTTDHRMYQFRADTANSAKDWVNSLQKTIFRSHNDGDSVKISLPVDNIIDMEVSPVVEFAETVKIRVIESEESYAIDDYFFSFFSNSADAVEVLGNLVRNKDAEIPTQDLLSPVSVGVDRSSPREASPSPRSTSDRRGSGQRGRSTTPVRESVRATLRPYGIDDDGRMSPRKTDFSPTANLPARSSGDFATNPYSRGSFDRGSRSRSEGRGEASKRELGSRSPRSRKHESFDSTAYSEDRETDSSVAFHSPKAHAHMSASQILDRSDLFYVPTLNRLEDLPYLTGENVRQESRTSINSSSPHDPTEPAVIESKSTVPIMKNPLRGRSPGKANANEGLHPLRDTSSPTLQEIIKQSAFPLQRAGAFASYLRNRSNRLATESMSYIEKVSGMLAGHRKHYGENEGVVLSNDQDVDPEDEEAHVGHGDRFRAHFALPVTEKLQATYFGYLHRVLPLYGKIYISNRKFCFRSLLPVPRTKLVLPLKDIENVNKEKGFRFGYHGLVLVIRGHEELFFEFRSAGHRDDCTVTLLQILESVRFMEGSNLLVKDDDDAAIAAKAEHKALQEVRRVSSAAPGIVPPETTETVYDPEEAPPILFEDPRADVVNFRPKKSLRITCLTIGSRGDVQPYIALCKGLKEEGHIPRIATHREFQPWIEKYGIEFAPVEGDPAELMRICIENGMFTYSFLKEASSKFRTWIDQLLTSAWEACQKSDILIESPSAMAGIHIAEALSIPYFRAFTMPWTRTRAYPHAFAVPDHKIGGAYNYFSYVMFDNVFWRAISGQVNRWRKNDLGLQNTSLDRMQPNKVPFLYMFSPHVVVPPLDYSDWVRVTGYWFLDEGDSWNPPPELLKFIAKAKADKKKIVYVGFGSIVVSDPAALTQTVVDAVLKADVRCILAKGWSDRLGDPAAIQTEVPLPPQIHQIKSAPHDWLFRQIDAAVHHGGCGTTGASLRAGLPTVIKPFFGDQFFFGSRVEDLGVGIYLKKVNVSLLYRALRDATQDERMIVKARILGEQIRQENGVQTAIQAIYRDLDYAKTLIKVRQNASETLDAFHDSGREDSIEASWTFVGDESDPEFQQKIQSWEKAGIREGGRPRVSLDRATRGVKVVSSVEPVDLGQSWRRSQ